MKNPLTTLREALKMADSNICTHADTHRGGVLWTICDSCGAKWADDEGGFKPSVWEAMSVEAHDAITHLIEQMTLTPEELDQARFYEAHSIAGKDAEAGYYSQSLLDAYRELVRTNWTPPPAVPADLLRAREIVMLGGGEFSDQILNGDWDKSNIVQAVRIALWDTSLVIPAEVDAEATRFFWDAYNIVAQNKHTNSHTRAVAGLSLVFDLLRDRAAKGMEDVGHDQ